MNSENWKLIKMYRHIIEHTEYLGEGEEIKYYETTNWSSIPNYIPKKDSDIVMTEIKNFAINPKKYNRRKKNESK